MLCRKEDFESIFREGTGDEDPEHVSYNVITRNPFPEAFFFSFFSPQSHLICKHNVGEKRILKKKDS